MIEPLCAGVSLSQMVASYWRSVPLSVQVVLTAILNSESSKCMLILLLFWHHPYGSWSQESQLTDWSSRSVSSIWSLLFVITWESQTSICLCWSLIFLVFYIGYCSLNCGKLMMKSGAGEKKIPDNWNLGSRWVRHPNPLQSCVNLVVSGELDTLELTVIYVYVFDEVFSYYAQAWAHGHNPGTLR
jgi:hypothetical protein